MKIIKEIFYDPGFKPEFKIIVIFINHKNRGFLRTKLELQGKTLHVFPGESNYSFLMSHVLHDRISEFQLCIHISLAAIHYYQIF